MGILGVTKWGIKLGAVGGASYWAYQERVFGTPDETRAAWRKFVNLCTNNQVVKMIPEVEIPKEMLEWKPPKGSMESYRSGLRQYWNTGVIYTFDGLYHLPQTISGYALQGWETLKPQLVGDGNAQQAKEESASEKASEKKED